MGKSLKGKELGKNIYQRKDGRYEARTIINGHLIDIYDMNLKSLLDAFGLEKAKVMRNEYGIRPKVTLAEWYQEWFEKVKAPQLKSDVCRKTYDRRVKNTIVRLLGDKQIRYISQIDIQEACRQLIEDEGYTPRTVGEAVGIIRECLDAAVANSVLVTNPCLGIKIRDESIKKERRVLSHDEQNRFLDEIKGTYYEEVYKILLLTGMRIGELSGLQWQDVDYLNKVIHIRRSLQTAYYDGKKVLELTTPKTKNSIRTIPFFGETEQCFRNWKKKQDTFKKQLGKRWRNDENKYGDLVFTTTLGSPVTRYVLQSNLKKIERDINLKEMTDAYMNGRPPREFKHIHPHAFRHTFATRCFEKGMNPVVVQSIMGHANYATTLSYTHVLDEERRKAVEKIGNFLD